MKTQLFKRKLDGSNFLLFVTIVLFVIMYIAGCIIFADAGFGKFQTFCNMLPPRTTSSLAALKYLLAPICMMTAGEATAE